MPGSNTRTKFRTRDAIGYNALSILPMDAIAAPGINQVAGTIQGPNFATILPVSCKIIGATIYQNSTTMVTNGTSLFNVAAGFGTYETAAGVHASDFGTAGGTVHTGDVITLVFNIPNAIVQSLGGPVFQTGVLGFPPIAGGQQIPFVYTVKSTDTTATILANSIAQSFNSQQLSILPDVCMANTSGASGVVNFFCMEAGTAQNSIQLFSSVTGAGATTTFAINALNFSGGTATTGVVTGVNDQFEYVGMYNFAPASYLAGALSATPLFNTDQPLFNGHGITGNINGSPGNNQYWADNFDVIYQQGTAMTLRLITPAANPPTNVKCNLLYMPFDVVPVAFGGFLTFDPHNDIG
jgi:hypothetical protein